MRQRKDQMRFFKLATAISSIIARVFLHCYYHVSWEKERLLISPGEFQQIFGQTINFYTFICSLHPPSFNPASLASFIAYPVEPGRDRLLKSLQFLQKKVHSVSVIDIFKHFSYCNHYDVSVLFTEMKRRQQGCVTKSMADRVAGE